MSMHGNMFSFFLGKCLEARVLSLWEGHVLNFIRKLPNCFPKWFYHSVFSPAT